MHETHFPESKALVSAAYEDETEELTIRLRTGRTYVYRGVETDVYDALVSADSAGRFYNGHIKDRYPFAEVHVRHVPVEPRLFGTMHSARRRIDPSRSGRRLHARRARRG